MRFTIDRLDHLVLNVRDPEVTASWYQRVLGMERENFGPDGDRIALKFGGQKINVRPAAVPQEKWITGAAIAPGSDDLCFITAVGPEHVVHHLGECGVKVETGPVERTGALGLMQSVYCRDPDGNLIEISSYLGR
jgi:catechol 2,3-dioxygenase-like lactoylglutathione lyase family enzyme